MNASSTNGIRLNECGTLAKSEGVDLRCWKALPDHAPLFISIFQMKPNLDNTFSGINFSETHVTSLAPNRPNGHLQFFQKERQVEELNESLLEFI